MAKVDGELSSFYMNPNAYSQVKAEAKKPGSNKRAGKTGFGKIGFSRFMEGIRSKTAGELGPFPDLPVTEKTLNALMDDVRSAGDALRGRPFPDEIIRYKQTVRNFIHYVVENSYSIDHETGIPNFIKPNYNGPRGTDKAKECKNYTKIQVIDKKLENMAAMLLSSQMPQLELASRLEEIKGLLIDLLQ